MKALSIRQPWAWLIVNGHKDIENRSWPTRYRGRFWVHASQTFDKDGLAWIKERFPEIQLPDTFERGGIIGSAFVDDCVTASASPWFFGEHGFVLSNQEVVPFWPCKGTLGWFTPKAAT